MSSCSYSHNGQPLGKVGMNAPPLHDEVDWEPDTPPAPDAKRIASESRALRIGVECLLTGLALSERTVARSVRYVSGVRPSLFPG